MTPTDHADALFEFEVLPELLDSDDPAATARRLLEHLTQFLEEQGTSTNRTPT